MKILLLLMMCLSFGAFATEDTIDKDCEGTQVSASRESSEETVPEASKDDNDGAKVERK